MGNCLDYTNNPANNLHPGDINMARLQSIYNASFVSSSDDDYVVHDNDDNAGGNDDNYYSGRRGRRRRNLRRVILTHYLYV